MRPGSILREVDSQEAFIVLASLKWALLCWPVIQAHDDARNTYRLSLSGPLSWPFVWSVNHHVACQPLPKMVQDVGVTFELSTWESPVKACLWCSTDLVFQELQYLAPYLGMAEPGSYSRIELVQTMAALVGDDEFVREVLAKEEAKMKKRKKNQDGEDDDDTDDEEENELDQLAELVLDEMDKADHDDFKELKKRVFNKESEKKKRKWKKAWDDVT